MATVSDPGLATAPEVFYPDSDGEPLGETSWHVWAILTLLQTLTEFLKDRPDAYVASDMFLYYEQGNPKAVRAPDCMVCLGVRDKEPRATFKTWVEGVVPSVIFEVSSVKTFQEDLHNKRALYARLGVREYFLFDPLGDCLDPRLKGFRLAAGEYEELPLEPDGGLTSQVLALHMFGQAHLLRFTVVQTGLLLPVFDDYRDFSEQERLNAEREQRIAEQERLNAEQERLNAEREREIAGQERKRAEDLAAEVARLRSLLDQRDVAGRGESSGGPRHGDGDV